MVTDCHLTSPKVICHDCIKPRTEIRVHETRELRCVLAIGDTSQ